jgi:DNA-binding NarL/FixJ family response regulator
MPKAAPNVSVLLADSATVVRKTIKGLLEEISNIDVLSEADSIEETISLATALKPDVILLDLSLSDSDRVDVDFLRDQFFLCGSRVLAMTIRDVNADDSKKLAESVGAVVLLDKANLFHDLVPAILNKKSTYLTTAQRITRGIPDADIR